jgi:hypothetical protein
MNDTFTQTVVAMLADVPRTPTWQTKTIDGRLVYNVRRLTGLVHDMYPIYEHVFLWMQWSNGRVACVRGNEVVWVDENTLQAALALDGLYDTGASERVIFKLGPPLDPR